MVRGQLRCLGTSLELKQRFGSGYKISVCFEPDGHNRKNNLVELLRKSMKPRQSTHVLFILSRIHACLTIDTNFAVDISCDHIHWNVPHEFEDRLPFLLTHLKVRKRKFIFKIGYLFNV